MPCLGAFAGGLGWLILEKQYHVDPSEANLKTRSFSGLLFSRLSSDHLLKPCVLKLLKCEYSLL